MSRDKKETKIDKYYKKLTVYREKRKNHIQNKVLSILTAIMTTSVTRKARQVIVVIDRKIFVSNDLTKEQRIDNKRIRECLFKYKQKFDSIEKISHVHNTKLLCENKMYDEHSALKFIRSLNLVNDKERGDDSDSAESIKSSASTIPTIIRKRGRPEGSKNNPLKVKKLKKL